MSTEYRPRFVNTNPKAKMQKAVLIIVVTAIAMIIVASVVMAILYPNVTSDYQFVRVPTLTPISP